MNTHLVNFRFILFFLIIILPPRVGATENVVKYDSLSNINSKNVHTLIGQTIIYPSNEGDIPILSNLFWVNKKGKIYSPYGHSFTDGKSIFDKRLLILDIIKTKKGNLLLECEMIEDNNKIYINCNQLFSLPYSIMYIEGYFKKIKNEYIGKKLYMRSFFLDEWNKKIVDLIPDAEALGYRYLNCHKVAIRIARNGEVNFFLVGKNPNGINLKSYLGAKVNGDIVEAAIAKHQEKVRIAQEKQALEQKAKLKSDSIRNKKLQRIYKIIGKKIDFSNDKYVDSLDEVMLKKMLSKYEQEKVLAFVLKNKDLAEINEKIKKYGIEDVYNMEFKSFNKVDWVRFDKLAAKYGKNNAKLMIQKRAKLGWTKEMLIESIGRPNDINRSFGSWGTHEQWVYREYSSEFNEYITEYYYFENGILTTIQD